MPRQISTTTHQQQFGAEPINVIEIQWVEDGNRILYADRDIPAENILGKIVLLDKLDFIINVDQGSDSQEISIGLSDVDGDLKSIIDTHDIHKRDVWVYQWFDGDDFADKFLIFQGQINSPITWNERDRTLKFSVISRIEDAEVGFSVEEGEFSSPSEHLIGKPWPLKFGTTIKVPALALSTPSEGTLSGGIGIRDFNLDFKLFLARRITCPFIFRGFTSRYEGLSLVLTPIHTPEEGCVLQKCRNIEELELRISEQAQYEYSQISIVNGDKFPQNQQITLNINGAKFTGQFTGTTENPSNTFSIVSRRHPKLDEMGVANLNTVRNAIDTERDGFVASGCMSLSDSLVPEDPAVIFTRLSQISIQLFNAVPTPGFFWADAGSKVTIDTGEQTIYISNLLPETIHSISAFKNLSGGQRLLLTIPPSVYSTRSTNFGSYQVSEIVFNTPLSRLDGEWEDDIYVISTSSVGPNTVDILEWLIQKYTTLSIDSTSFDLVKTALEEYPSDFPILDRPNVLDILQDIAFQARCAIYIRDRKFYLKYLPAQSAFDDTIGESDVDENTLELFHTDTEELVTKLVAEWKRDYSKEDDNKLILRHNIERYGTHEETFGFFIYNELDYVHKSATFWLIRKSNTWRNLRFKTPLQTLKLETFDSVGITLPDLADGQVYGLVTQSSYDSDNQTVEFEIWSPIRSGTRVQYDFAFPGDIDEDLVWPTEEDRVLGFAGSGSAPGFSTLAPSGHPLSTSSQLTQGFSLGPCASQGKTVASISRQTCGGGDGDTYPADEGDSKKTKQTEADTPPRVGAVEPGEINATDRFTVSGPSETEQLNRRIDNAEQQNARGLQLASNANEAAGGVGSGSAGPGGGSGDDRDPLEDLPSEDELREQLGDAVCMHIVIVFMHKGEILFKDGFVGSQGIGYPGFAPLVRKDKHIFNSKQAATDFTEAMLEEIQSREAAQNVSQEEVFPYAVSRNLDNRPECDDEPDDPKLIGFEQLDPEDDEEIEDFIPPEYL